MTTIGKRFCCTAFLFFLLSLLCLHGSASAKVYKGTWYKNTKWQYDTSTKTVTIDCKGKMEDNFSDCGPGIGWGKWYLKAKKVVFKKGITYIGGGSFTDFRNLEDVILPEGLKTIGRYAFQKTEKLKTIHFPSSLKKIGGNAFESSGIETVDFRKVETIGREAFVCSKLKKAVLSSKVKTIKPYAFSWCEDLKEVTLPPNLKEIGKGTFWSSGLESITIPASVTAIQKEAFYSRDASDATLKSVTILSTKINVWGKDVFGKASKDLVIRVPKSKKKEYAESLRVCGLPSYVKIVGF
jgi:hypothetical protein